MYSVSVLAFQSTGCKATPMLTMPRVMLESALWAASRHSPTLSLRRGDNTADMKPLLCKHHDNLAFRLSARPIH